MSQPIPTPTTTDPDQPFLSAPLAGPAAWRAPELGDAQGWRTRLSEDHFSELLQAVATARASGLPTTAVQRENFPLPGLAPVLGDLAGVLEGGRGFHILRGLPVAALDDAGTALMLWGIGLYLGVAEPQDRAGALLHVVTDTGQSVDATDNVRGFQTNNELSFHTDGADIFALLCVRPALRGGESRLVSSTAVFNELVRRRPDLARVLQQPFHFDARAQSPFERKVQSVPIFNYHHGRLSALYKRRYIELAQRFAEVPRLTAEQTEALDLLDSIAADPALALYYHLEPGDVAMANNYTCFHARTAYEDHAEPEQKRCMQRLWLTLDNGRPLPEVFADTREWGLTYRRRHGT